MNRIVFSAFLPDRINGIQRIFFFSQFPPARNASQREAGGDETEKGQSASGGSDTLLVVECSLDSFAASKNRSFPRRGIGLFAFLLERQKIS